jgi:predicted DCC family thiol-disulfide oxidoreductase YuxK
MRASAVTTTANRLARYAYRADKAVPAFPDDKPVIIFDGDCVLCSAWANFVLRHDHKARYRLLPAQTPLGHALYAHFGLDPLNYETNILLDDGTAWFKSEGSIRMFEGLGLPWSIVRTFRILPFSWREGLYDWVARNRFRFFGRRDSCYLSNAKYAERFLA